METFQSAQANEKTSPVAELGQEIATFHSRNQTSLRVIGLAFGISIILAASGFFILRFSEMVTAIRLHSRAIILHHAPSLLLLLACIPLGVLILLITGINWNNHLTLYEGGFIRSWGLRKKTWYWQSTTRLDTRITHIKLGANIINMRIKLLMANQNENLVIRNRYRPMQDLIHQIRSILVPILWKQALGQLARNESVSFHKGLVATWLGLEIRGVQVPWHLIDTAIIKNHKLILQGVQEIEKLIQVNLNQINNLDLLLFLLNNPPN